MSLFCFCRIVLISGRRSFYSVFSVLPYRDCSQAGYVSSSMTAVLLLHPTPSSVLLPPPSPHGCFFSSVDVLSILTQGDLKSPARQTVSEDVSARVHVDRSLTLSSWSGARCFISLGHNFSFVFLRASTKCVAASRGQSDTIAPRSRKGRHRMDLVQNIPRLIRKNC